MDRAAGGHGAAGGSQQHASPPHSAPTHLQQQQQLQHQMQQQSQMAQMAQMQQMQQHQYAADGSMQAPGSQTYMQTQQQHPPQPQSQHQQQQPAQQLGHSGGSGSVAQQFTFPHPPPASLQPLTTSQSASPPNSYAQQQPSHFVSLTATQQHAVQEGTGAGTGTGTGMGSGSTHPPALIVSDATPSPPNQPHARPHVSVSLSSSPPSTSALSSARSNNNPGSARSSSGRGILRKDLTPSRHNRGVSFTLPEEYLAEKERARNAEEKDLAQRKAKAIEESLQAQSVAAALATAQMSSPFVYPQEGLAAVPLSAQASASSSSAIPVTGLMSRQQKTAFHPLTTPASALASVSATGGIAASAAAGGSSRMLNPIQINPATAAANAAAHAQALALAAAAAVVAQAAANSSSQGSMASLLSPVGTTPMSHLSPPAQGPSSASLSIPAALPYATRRGSDSGGAQSSISMFMQHAPLPMPAAPQHRLSIIPAAAVSSHAGHASNPHAYAYNPGGTPTSPPPQTDPGLLSPGCAPSPNHSYQQQQQQYPQQQAQQQSQYHQAMANRSATPASTLPERKMFEYPVVALSPPLVTGSAASSSASSNSAAASAAGMSPMPSSSSPTASPMDGGGSGSVGSNSSSSGGQIYTLQPFGGYSSQPSSPAGVDDAGNPIVTASSSSPSPTTNASGASVAGAESPEHGAAAASSSANAAAGQHAHHRSLSQPIPQHPLPADFDSSSAASTSTALSSLSSSLHSDSHSHLMRVQPLPMLHPSPPMLPLSNTVPRLSLINMQTPSPPPAAASSRGSNNSASSSPGAGPPSGMNLAAAGFGLGINVSSSPAHSSGSSSAGVGGGGSNDSTPSSTTSNNSGLGSSGSGSHQQQQYQQQLAEMLHRDGSMLHTRQGFPSSSQSSGGSMAQGSFFHSASGNSQNSGSSSSSYHGRSSPARSSPVPPRSISPSLRSATHSSSSGSGHHHHDAQPTSAPPSPSKQSRPLNFSWGSPSTNQRWSTHPVSYCVGYLLPHLWRVIRSRTARRKGFVLIRALACIAVTLGLVGVLLFALQPERTINILPQGSRAQVKMRSLAEDWSLVARAGVVHDTSELAGAQGTRPLKTAEGWIGVSPHSLDSTDEEDVNEEDLQQSQQQRDKSLSASIISSGEEEEEPLLSQSEDTGASEFLYSPLSLPALRPCSPSDLACRIRDIPIHPRTGVARVLLVVINAGFKEMALNLVCSGDMVGGSAASTSNDGATAATGADSAAPWTRDEIPRAAWLIACSDEESYEFFLARGVAAVRMNATSELTPAASAAPSVASAVRAGERLGRRDPYGSESTEAEVAAEGRTDAASSDIVPLATASAAIGAHASSWGESTHININREKVPLVLALLRLGVDVTLVDADVVFLSGLGNLFDVAPSAAGADLAVMYDYPLSVSMPPLGESMDDCLRHVYTNSSAVCNRAWQMNGGFFLLRASHRTISLYEEMIAWMRDRPQDHDQDALRVALRERASRGSLAWRTKDGSLFPPQPASPGVHKGDVLSYTFLDSLRAPNGGLYFLETRREFLEATNAALVAGVAASGAGSSSSSLLPPPPSPEPDAIHVNWVVGYARKAALMKQYGLWFVSHAPSASSRGRGASTGGIEPGAAYCTNVLLEAAKNRDIATSTSATTPRGRHRSTRGGGAAAASAQAAAAAARAAFIVPPRNPLRISTPADVARLNRPPFASAPSALIVLGVTPKPLRSFLSLPASRAADSDGLGGFDAEKTKYTDSNVAAWKDEQILQLHAQMYCVRNWYAMTHAQTHRHRVRRSASGEEADGGDTAFSSLSSANGLSVALFSDDPAHASLARSLRMDVFTGYDRDEYGLPTVSGLFQHLEALARKKGAAVAMYSNADIMFEQHSGGDGGADVGSAAGRGGAGLLDTVAAIERYGFETWAAVGMRSNVESSLVRRMENDVDKKERDDLLRALHSNAQNDASSSSSSPLPITRSSSASLFSRLSPLSRPYRTDALDFFLWTPGFWEWDSMPRGMLLGRIGFDNFLLHVANMRAKASASLVGGGGGGGTVVVDVSDTVQALHINHGSVPLVPVDSAEASPAASTATDSLLSDLAASSSTLIASHFTPNSMINIKLAGQTSLKGLGTLEHVVWRTERLGGSASGGGAGGQIRVLRARPKEGGHTAELFDVARESHVRIHARLSLIVVTADQSNIPQLKNWVWHMRRALRNGGPQDASSNAGTSRPMKTGILVFSASPSVTALARSLGVGVFELSPGERSAQMLNGPASANLQIAGLRSRATLLLVEYGYDVFLSSVNHVWRRNPWRIVAERARIVEYPPVTHQMAEETAAQSALASSEYVRRVRMEEQLRILRAENNPRPSLSPRDSSSSGAPSDAAFGSGSFNPVSSLDGLFAGNFVDLVTFSYDSAPFNVSSLCMLVRHTPGALKFLRRVQGQVLALVARASLTPPQLNYHNLQLDWIVQYELYSNHRYGSSVSPSARISWATVALDAGVFSLPPDLLAQALSQPPSGTGAGLPSLRGLHLPAGPVKDRDVIFALGYWGERSGGLGTQWAEQNARKIKDADAWDERSQTSGAAGAAGDSFASDPCATPVGGSIDCGALSAAELELVRSVCTEDQSVALIPVPSASSSGSQLDAAALAATPFNMFLSRAREVGFTNLVLVADSPASLRAALSEENLAREPAWAVLYGSGTNDASASPSSPSSSAHASLLAMRTRQLLVQSIAVGVFNVPAGALLFGSPFQGVTNRAWERRRSEEQDRVEAESGSSELSHRGFLASQGLWRSSLASVPASFLRPLSDLSCDVFGPGAASVNPSSSAHNGAMLLTASPTSWTWLSLQPGEQSIVWAGRVIQCTAAAGSAGLQDVDKQFERCMESVAEELRLLGELSLCELDPMLFPAASSFFEPPPLSSRSAPAPTVSQAEPTVGRGHPAWIHPSETGVWPLVVPGRHESIATGRVQEWDRDWRRRVAQGFGSYEGSLQPIVPPPVVPSDAAHPISCVADPSSAAPNSFAFRIRILTFSRARSLERLLASLARVDFQGDSGRIRLEVSVDRPEGDDVSAGGESESDAAREERTRGELAAAAGVRMDDDPRLAVAQKRLQVLRVLSSFHWPHGPLHVILHQRHLGLVGQWIHSQSDPGSEGPRTDGRDVSLVLEDDMEVSPFFYAWTKGALCAYYLSSSSSSSSFDPDVFGFSLQAQHYVLGQSAKNSRAQFLRFREEKSRREQRASAAAAAAAGSSSPALIAASAAAAALAAERIDPSTLFDLSHSLGDPVVNPVYRYQLLGTWGLLVFPPHWKAFHSWARPLLDARAQAGREVPGGGGGEPCVPHLESSAWWAARPHAVWSQWFIRYTFERGWSCLYANLPAAADDEQGGSAALATNHREAGENYAAGLGPRNSVLREAPALVGAAASLPPGAPASLPPPSPSSGLRFRFPPLDSTPLLDFHATPVTNSVVLRQRAAMLTSAHFKRGCVAKDYAPFEP